MAGLYLFVFVPVVVVLWPPAMRQSNVGIPGTGEAMSIMLKVMDNVASVGEGSQILVNQGAADAVRWITPVLSSFCTLHC